MGSEIAEFEEKTLESHEEERRGTKRESLEEEGSKSKRPSRERRSVERFCSSSPRKASASKSLSISQGSGTKLKEIPNVVFKLSKRKVDENLQALHTILFGRKSNVHFLKRNIFQFSGFVWTEDQEKHKEKLKEKLDKYTKDKLIDFCELLDIQFPKATTKKDEISAKLLEFLESPHATRDLLLADKEKKSKKRRSGQKLNREAAEDAALKKETKKSKKSAETEVKTPKAEEDESEDRDSGSTDDTKDASSGKEDTNGLEEGGDHVKHEDDEENEYETPMLRKDGFDEAHLEEAAELEVKKASSGKIPSNSASKQAVQPVEDELAMSVDSKSGSTSTEERIQKCSKAVTKEKAAQVKEDKNKSSSMSASVDTNDSGSSKSSESLREDKKKGWNKEKAVPEDKKAGKKKESKTVPKVSTKEQGKAKKNTGPSTEELHSVVSDVLREVDFNTATLADILKQLGVHFDTDLMDRKAEVKSIIEDVINNMTDDDDDGDGDGDEDENNLGDNMEGGSGKKEQSDGDGKE